MIDPAAVEEAWQRPWPRMTRKMRRFLVTLAAGEGILFLALVPLQLLGALVSEQERTELLGSAALFFVLGAAGAVTAVVLHRRFDPEHRAEDALKRSGARIEGHLLKWRHTPAAGNIPTNSYYLFGAEVPGAGPVFARLTARNGLPLGTPATIAYDPARPGEGVVVETRVQLGRRARAAAG